MNEFRLSGRLTGDPVSLRSGTVAFTVAQDRFYQSRDQASGDFITKKATDFLRCYAVGSAAEAILTFSKGEEVRLEGHLESRSRDGFFQQNTEDGPFEAVTLTEIQGWAEYVYPKAHQPAKKPAGKKAEVETIETADSIAAAIG